MAKNVVINGVTYSDCPSVQIPLADGQGNAEFVDTTDANATAGTIVNGNSAYVNGQKVNGSLTLVSVSQNSTTKVLTIS